MIGGAARVPAIRRLAGRIGAAVAAHTTDATMLGSGDGTTRIGTDGESRTAREAFKA